MNINYELYKVFYAVAKNGNITKAAMELMISQPAISKSIKNLEEQLGGELFTRTKKGVVLTEEGREFYNYIEKAISYIDSAENKFSELISLDTGKIVIGTSSTLLTRDFLMPYLGRYHKLFPKINIEVVTGEIDDLIIDLRNGILDVLILMLPVEASADIEIIKCQKVEDVFITNKESADLIGKKIKLNELDKYPLILPVLRYNDRKVIDSYFLQNNFYVKPIMEVSSYTLMKEFVKNGFGIGIISNLFIKEELKEKALAIVDVEPKLPSRYIGIVHLKRKDVSFSTRKLIDLITEKE